MGISCEERKGASDKCPGGDGNGKADLSKWNPPSQMPVAGIWGQTPLQNFYEHVKALVKGSGTICIESAQSVEVAIYKSFIEIYSPGKFPDEVTPEQFITEIRKPIRRNPLITRTLYYSKDMESFATGLKRIHDACSNVGVKVEFYGDTYGFTVRFYRHCGEGWNNAMDDIKDDANGVKNGVNELSIREKVIECIRADYEISIADIVKETGVSRRTVDRVIKRLKEENIIERMGSSRSGSWKILM